MGEQAVFDTLKYRIKVTKGGTRCYYNNAGQLHRDDGPAVEYADGLKYWYQNGQKHRTDGPAVVGPNGYKEWYQDGQLHRTDGPLLSIQMVTKAGSRMANAIALTGRLLSGKVGVKSGTSTMWE